MKCVFAGTPEIASLVLEGVIIAGYQISLVLTKPDAPSGRGMKLMPSPVKKLALANNLPVYQPEKLKDNPEAWHKIKELSPDIIIVVAYGLIIPAEYFEIARLGFVNVHVSLLPRWRGAAPIQRSILAGDRETGVTIMQINQGLDTGAILLQGTTPIEAEETAKSLHDKLAYLGRDKLIEYLTAPEKYPPIPQNEEGVCYAQKIKKSEALIDWAQDSALIKRKIQAFNPAPGAFSYLSGVLYKFWQIKLVEANTQELPGTIVSLDIDKLWIASGNGKICAVEIIQKAGSVAQDITNFLRGNKLELGMRFLGEERGKNE